MAKKKSSSQAASSDKPPKGDSAKFWQSELTAAGKREKTWRDRAKRVIDRYRDERDKHQSSERRTNILWSNTEILKAVLFQDIGNPDVRRRFPKKGKDEKAARTTALVIERALSFTTDDYDVKAQIECVVEDHLLAGRGQAWLVYDAELIEGNPDLKDDDDGSETKAVKVASGPNDDDEPEPIDIADQSVRIEHVYWEDYRTSAGRKENDIWWKARKHLYTRKELKLYFPEHGAFVPLDAEPTDTPKKTHVDSEESDKRAVVWEIWDKSERERIYVSEGYDYILKKDDDPYKLRQFFPCPPSLYGVKTTSSLVPIPEYTLYQDQCEELDTITTRLNRLIDALKRRGVYDSSLEGADNQLSQLAYAEDNQFLPFKGFSGLMEKGGLKAAFQTEDLSPIIEAVSGLYQQRAQLMQTIYEVTGISDVLRGSSNPNDTATAQRIKGQFGSLRITTRQAKVQEFVRACYRLKAEIVSEHYTREKLQDMTGIDMPMQSEIDQANQQLAMVAQIQQQQQAAQASQQPPQGAQGPGGPGMPPGAPQGAPTLPPGAAQAPQPPPMPMPSPDAIQEMQDIVKCVAWEDIESILRSDDRRGYKIDIETEDTANFDEQEEKQNRVELLNTMQPVLQNVQLMIQQSPDMLPLAREIMMFTIKGFKAGRQLEETFEDAFNELGNRPPQPPPPNPDMAKVGIEKSKADAEIQIKQQLAAHEAEKMQIENQLRAADLQGKQLDLQGKQLDLHSKNQQMNLDFMQAQADAASQAVANDRENEAHQMEMAAARQDMQNGAVAAHAKAQATVAKSQQNTVKTPSKASNGAVTAPSPQPQMQAPVSQLQLILQQLVKGQQELMQSNELLARAVTAPKTTQLIRDAQGRSVGAIQKTAMSLDQPQGNA